MKQHNQLSAENLEFLNDQRIEIARDASCEIEGLSQLIINLSNQHDDSCPDDTYRGIPIRIKNLSCIVLGAIADSADNEVELSARLNG